MCGRAAGRRRALTLAVYLTLTRTRTLAARLVVLEDLGARAHLPSALGTDDVVLGRVLALVHLEPQLHVAHRVVGLRRRGRTRRSHTHGVTQAQAQAQA